MRGHAWRIIAVAAVAGMLAVQAAAADDLQTCEDESGDVGIAACTRVIASGRYSGDDLATLHSNRGVEYGKKGDLERAIADFDQAIKLNPKDPSVYNNRGLAWKIKGDLDRAIADEDQAIKLDPKDASPYFNRALALEGKGDLQRALADFKTFTELDPSDPDGPAAVARVTEALKGR